MINHQGLLLLTGATGFLGAAINQAFDQSKTSLTTLGRSLKNDIVLNLEQIYSKDSLKFQKVIHCAGTAHFIPKNPQQELQMENGNFLITKNLIDAIDTSVCRQFIYISTVAVYGKDQGLLISENDAVQPKTTYGKSKLEAEEYILNWGRANDILVVILRLPLIMGHNPPGNLRSILKFYKKGLYFHCVEINPLKSIVFASDVAHFLVQSDFKHSGVFNLAGANHPNLRQIENFLKITYRIKHDPFPMPYVVLKALAKIGDIISLFPLNSTKLKKLSVSLTFDDSKARSLLNWNPQHPIE